VDFKIFCDDTWRNAAVNLFYNEQSAFGQKIAPILQGADAMFIVILIVALTLKGGMKREV
jgi:hypothetical protein